MADRVIIVDIRRANEELRARDVQQMAGRSGRVHGESDSSDVHLIMTHQDLERWKKILENPASYEIRSNLNDVSIFAFHVISHIVRGDICNKTTFYDWYDRTLDKFQREKRGEKIPNYEDVALELHQTGCAEYNTETGEIKAKPLGKICAAYYFSPYDVRDWFSNICELHKRDLLYNDACQAWAMSNLRSAMDWESEAIKRASEDLVDKIVSQRLSVKNGTMSRLLATDCVLHGKYPKCDLPIYYSVKNDMSRILTAWESIVKISRKILGDATDFIETLKLRYQHGVPSRLTRLIKLPGIGKTTAKALYENYEIRSQKDLLSNFDFVYENSSSGIKRSLTNFKNHYEKIENFEKPKITYKEDGKRTREGIDEFGDLA